MYLSQLEALKQFEYQNQYQKSVGWVLDQLGCQKQIGDMVFNFKKFLQDFIHSIDAKFNKNDIEKAFYHSKEDVGVAYIYIFEDARSSTGS